MDGENSRQKQGPKKKTKADFSDDKKSPSLEKIEFPFTFSALVFLAQIFPPFFSHFDVTLNINKENVNVTFPPMSCCSL